ncbi:hypothetical protein [Maledivibacter halophilus]|uniref:Uncharacterized protein n=1 Tax=Maledivibacter halophilus TaxID=36842 RepID=A0A1T5K1D6_9FIRM|nr:hypothetical protein [Maledivibacter halophilus]SKC57335.1 hypothetical protein SAMN02194393_01531 [Maledivibacter halophilus]
MEQEKILSMILSKLDNIEKDQQEMKKDLKDMSGKLDTVELRLHRLEEGQESIKKFMFESEKAFKKFEQDHIFIEKLKKVVGE